jgi:PHD/YefM family antitoxin component YafN of YafNO toxin-antitoxin module
MEEVNALKIRNNLGEVLDRLNKTGEPIFVSKGRKIRAVLVTPDQFEKRFLDRQIEEKRKKFIKAFKRLRKGRKGKDSSLNILRLLRGYPE